jgi:hypothetical protein
MKVKTLTIIPRTISKIRSVSIHISKKTSGGLAHPKATVPYGDDRFANLSMAIAEIDHVRFS